MSMVCNSGGKVPAVQPAGIHLGEAALNMVQNAEYELPYLRKQVGAV